MKVAVMVYGQYRSFELSITSWNFLNNGYDFYFSTWNNSKQYNKKFNVDIEFTVDENMIKKFVPNSTISILDEYQYELETVDGENRPNKMMYHWRNCLKLIEDSQKIYDRILIIRIDSYFEFQIPLNDIITKSKNKVLYLYNDLIKKNEKTWAQDLFFMGDQDIIFDFIKKTPERVEDIHYDLGRTILNNKYDIDFVEPKIRVCPSTPLLNSYDKNKISYMVVHDEWIKWINNGKDYEKKVKFL